MDKYSKYSRGIRLRMAGIAHHSPIRVDYDEDAQIRDTELLTHQIDEGPRWLKDSTRPTEKHKPKLGL